MALSERVQFKYDLKELVDAGAGNTTFSGVKATDVGADEFILPNEVSYFDNLSANDQEDGLGNTVSLEFVELNDYLTNRVYGAPVYDKVKVTDPTYQTGDIYFFGSVGGSIVLNDDANRLQNQIDLLSTLGRSVGERFASYDETPPPGTIAFDYDNAVTQSEYSELYAIVGDQFEQEHLDAGDTASGAGNFYPTPIPERFPRAAKRPDSFTDSNISTTGDAIQGLTSAVWRGNIRVGTPYRFEVVSGTAPTGITADSIYYVQPTATGYGLFTTEADAIAGTSEVSPTDTGSGSFRLVQSGLSLSDAFQGHTFGQPSDNARVLAKASEGGSGTSNRVRTISSDEDLIIVTDGTNGTPRTSNETRGGADYVYYYIQAKVVNSQGETLDSKIKIATLKDVKATGTNAGSSVAGRQARTLNTVSDPGGIGVTLVNPTDPNNTQFIVPAGKYYFEAFVNGYRVANHKAYLRNITTSNDDITGSPEFADNLDSAGHSISISTTSQFGEQIELSEDTTFEIQHDTALATTNNGLGIAANDGGDEIYTRLKIMDLSSFVYVVDEGGATFTPPTADISAGDKETNFDDYTSVPVGGIVVRKVTGGNGTYTHRWRSGGGDTIDGLDVETAYANGLHPYESQGGGVQRVKKLGDRRWTQVGRDIWDSGDNSAFVSGSTEAVFEKYLNGSIKQWVQEDKTGVDINNSTGNGATTTDTLALNFPVSVASVKNRRLYVDCTSGPNMFAGAPATDNFDNTKWQDYRIMRLGSTVTNQTIITYYEMVGAWAETLPEEEIA